MNRKRLTREDSREQTMQRLLDAAQKIIAKKGLEGASVEDISAAAGYSRGAFYSNFGSKYDLFIELLRRDHERAHSEFFALLDDKLSLDQVQAGIRDIYSKLYRDEGFISWTEARLLSARDSKFRAKLNALMLEKRSQIVQLIEYFNKRAGIKAVVSPSIMAMGFMSMCEGVKLFCISSPNEMTPEAAETTLTMFFDSIMYRGRTQTASTAGRSPTEVATAQKAHSHRE
jgi:AcrR family transcriptional regulator